MGVGAEDGNGASTKQEEAEETMSERLGKEAEETLMATQVCETE